MARRNTASRSSLSSRIMRTGKPLSALVQEIYDEYGEMHMAEYDWALTEATKQDIQRRILTERLLPDFGMPVSSVSYMDGCKVCVDGGWIIVRFSGTEPRVRVFAEMKTLAQADALVKVMADFAGLPFMPAAR